MTRVVPRLNDANGTCSTRVGLDGDRFQGVIAGGPNVIFPGSAWGLLGACRNGLVGWRERLGPPVADSVDSACLTNLFASVADGSVRWIDALDTAR
jgi:hypothetical protein